MIYVVQVCQCSASYSSWQKIEIQITSIDFLLEITNQNTHSLFSEAAPFIELRVSQCFQLLITVQGLQFSWQNILMPHKTL